MTPYDIKHTDGDLLLTCRKRLIVEHFAGKLFLVLSGVGMSAWFAWGLFALHPPSAIKVDIIFLLVIAVGGVLVHTPGLLPAMRLMKTGLALRFDLSHNAFLLNERCIAALTDVDCMQVLKGKMLRRNECKVMLVYKDGCSKYLQDGSYRECLDFAKEIAEYVGVTVNAPSV